MKQHYREIDILKGGPDKYEGGSKEVTYVEEEDGEGTTNLNVDTDGDGKPLPLTYNFSSEDFTVNESTNTVSLKNLSSIEDRLNKLEIEVFSSPAPAPTSTFTPV